MTASPHNLTEMYRAKVHNSELGTLPYRLLSPENSKDNQTFPLLIALHGSGERGDDNLSQLKHGAADFASTTLRLDQPAYVAMPQCPAKEWWSGNNLQLVMELVDRLLDREPIDPKRILITGISMGGYGTWTLLAQHPSRFAAAIPICGGGDPSQAEKMKTIPLQVFHGKADAVVSVEKSREMVNALKAVGAPVRYTEYPDAEHDSWTETYQNESVIKWLFSH